MQALILLVLGIAAIGLALWMVLPVMVNLPDSWFGALLIGLLLAGGSVLVYRARKSSERNRKHHRRRTHGMR